MSATAGPSHASTPLPAVGFILLASLGLFWGLNWPGMKIVLGEMTVWWFRGLSVAAGAIGLLAISALTGGGVWLRRGEVVPMLICALFAILGWNIFTGYGVALMPAGRASIIAFTMPVWAALFSSILLGEPMTRYKIAGLVLGLVGLGVLIGPDLVALGAAPLGSVFMLLAAVTWAIGLVLFKKYTWSSPVATVIGWQLLVGTAVILSVAIVIEPVPDFGALSWQAIAALAYLFTLPMVYCQWAFFTVVRIFPAAIAAIGTLSVPIVGVYSSALLLGEPVGWREFVAMLSIVAALGVVLILPNLAGTARRDR